MGEKRYRHRQSRLPLIIISVGVLFILLAVVKISYASRSVQVRPLIRSGLFSGNQCPATPPSPSIAPVHVNDSFNWRDLPIRNPVDSFAELPVEEPLELPAIQHQFRSFSGQFKVTQAKRRDAVRETFVKCWTSYKQYAWGHDELSPISGGYKDTYGGWGATLVDNLDTLLIMGLENEFEEAVEATTNVSFTPDGFDGFELNVFETVIRYLGGILSAYDLAGCKDARLLDKAMEVADLAYASMDLPNHMPLGRWRVHEYDKPLARMTNFGGLAELGSFSLEFSRLSMLTGDMRYFDAAQRVTQIFSDNQNKTKLPGMLPENIDIYTLDFNKSSSFTLGANADSTFEYFGKMYQLLGGHGPVYRKLYEESMSVAIENMIFKPKTHDNADILIAGDYHFDYTGNGFLHSRGQHLTSFAAGMLMLGGRLFNNDTHVEIGRKLADGCAWVYKNMPSGIMAETWLMTACPKGKPCHYDPMKAVFTGFGDARYLLRPEAIEAIFYAYRITGDPAYQDIAWSMFESINNKTSTPLGNAELNDVRLETPEQVDNMQSFWMAETLKYFYLMFSEPDLLSLDEWVFNTEAHPLRVPRSWRRRISNLIELDVELDL